MKTPQPVRSYESRSPLRSVLLVLLVAISSPLSAQEKRTTAVWKEREVDFIYRSDSNVYACGALEARVRSILRAVGARDDLVVRVHDCEHMVFPEMPLEDWQGDRRRLRERRTVPEQFSRVRIELKQAVEATPEVLEEVEKDKTRRELIARVTGNPAAMLEGAVQFPAEWQEITLSRKTIGLEPEECELLEQISRSVLRELNVRIVRRGYTCGRGEQSRIPPTLIVEALLPFVPAVKDPLGMPEQTEESRQASPPAAGEGQEPETAAPTNDPAAE